MTGIWGIFQEFSQASRCVLSWAVAVNKKQFVESSNTRSHPVSLTAEGKQLVLTSFAIRNGKWLLSFDFICPKEKT